MEQTIMEIYKRERLEKTVQTGYKRGWLTQEELIIAIYNLAIDERMEIDDRIENIVGIIEEEAWRLVQDIPIEV